MSDSPSPSSSRPIPATGVLSMSAGGDLTDIDKWRIVADQGRAARELAMLYPDLAERGFLEAPIQISVYPASIMRFGDALFIDTFLRPANLARALRLAHIANRPVLLCGQPLALAELLFEHLDKHRPVPTRMLVLMGGCQCPLGLEQRIRDRLSAAGVDHDIGYGYGTAEVAAGCLAGRRTDDGRVYYRLAAAGVAVTVEGGRLYLRRTDIEQAPVDTGDDAIATRVDGHDGWFIVPSAKRIAPAVGAALESWQAADWDRRTGYIAQTDEGLRFQVRRGVAPASAEEVGYHEFERRYESSLLEKPAWGE
ncbi:hypothetical protein [Haliangium sp.]|uniref:hypothetical protein n=1 Tax=Haliangium sp. TaxID=2663208 RepID=UPI003D0CBD17